jgi:hypothetical protein
MLLILLLILVLVELEDRMFQLCRKRLYSIFSRAYLGANSWITMLVIVAYVGYDGE